MTLGRIKSFSKRSFNFTFNYFISSGDIPYGRIEIGRVSRKTSIPKFISLVEGTPRRSYIMTFRNSFTTNKLNMRFLNTRLTYSD